METGISYFGNRILNHLATDLEDISTHGCTFVVHSLSEEDMQIYGATMRDIVHTTQASGLQAWLEPLGVGGVFSGEAFSLYAARFPNHQQVFSTGARVPAICPNWPDFRDFMRMWVDAALETGTNVLLWNVPRFATPRQFPWYRGPSNAWACRCAACQYLYRQRFGEEIPTVYDSSVRLFRQEQMLEFLAEVTGYAASQGATNALCLLPFEEHRGDVPWRAAASLPGVHIFGTYPAWLNTNMTPEECFGQKTARVVELCRFLGKQSLIWVQGFAIPTGREKEVATAIEIIAANRIDNVVVKGYDGYKHVSSIASERPDVVWDTVGRVYRQARRGSLSKTR
ncbi:MAG: hypothetical protein GFH27_549279n465 [Chloroflexi bacterium AL-W]|nr:hypothetical protein [Chloroflexi bacterium AL-N1]NOK65431.1 hypothetical protein [Chloroflexi bacterium AL-N10]NOK72303.1 hypothetical protein [Chloroflexi bacterium AL-N5]NOK79610.1 hypothetical protein [Chloroflexi bacterium AL-W]NOK87526.1 hypothetical protein [Chloroflexi bacterium AL-N15]